MNWAYASGQREDTSGWFMFVYEVSWLKCLNKCTCHHVLKIFFLQLAGHFNIFVGDLSPEVTDATLFACFSVYPSCS